MITGGSQGLPGLTTKITQQSRKFLVDNNHILRRGVVVHSTTQDTDGGHTPVTKIRAGTVLVRSEAGTKKWTVFGNAIAPGTIAAVIEAGLLMEDLDMLTPDGSTVEDKPASVLTHGIVNDSEVVWQGISAGADKTTIRGLMKLIKFNL